MVFSLYLGGNWPELSLIPKRAGGISPPFPCFFNHLGKKFPDLKNEKKTMLQAVEDHTGKRGGGYMHDILDVDKTVTGENQVRCTGSGTGREEDVRSLGYEKFSNVHLENIW